MATVDTEFVPRPLLGGYQAWPSGHDEMLGPDGLPRKHWETLIGSCERWSPNDCAGRRENARRLLREHGVTYNVYGDAQGLDRPWALDLLPQVIPADEWRRVEAGLAQRARLLNHLLADIYGPQRLLKENLLPSALIHANPGFLRACHGLRPPKNIFLFLHAVDLARAPDGQWWALADRTQAPSGAGYALENRIVLSRVLPDEYRDARVQRLSNFFQQVRDTLRALAPAHRDHPNIVLLTPGPYNETYFEHAFLARYLGFPLVEGGDLTVHNQRVFIKTLEGLQPVDVILRRLDDTFCDPLELRADSHLGVPGLLEAVRAGNVALANAPGSGAVETPALMAFLPGLCRDLLGEELKLPSVATWWCGQEKEFNYVRDHLPELVIKRAFAAGNSEPVFGAGLGETERAALLATVRARPFDYVAQEQVALSTVPVWVNGRLEPRPMVMRAYIAATPDGFSVLPGGLTRFSTSPDRLIVSMQSGGGSKDTWVFSDGPVSRLSLLAPTNQIVRRERAAAEVPSRVADNLYWLGRYAERLEDTVRLLRCVLGRLNSEAAEGTPELTALVRLLVQLDLFPEKFRERHSLADVEREVYLQIYQVHRLGTAREVLGRLKNIAFVLRDRFSADTWHILGKMQVDARPRPGRIPATEVLAMLNTLIVDLAAFSGMEMENMTRGHSWRFLDIGRRLERAANITTLVQGGLATETARFTAIEPVLEIAESVMTYRRRYYAQPQWPTVLDLLLADESNPRSLAFQIATLAEHTARLPHEVAGNGESREAGQITALRQLIAQTDLVTLTEGHLKHPARELSAWLAGVTTALHNIAESLNQHYFTHADTRVS